MTLPPGPLYAHQAKLYRRVNGQWKATKFAILSSPARFTLTIVRGAFEKPSAGLDLAKTLTSKPLYHFKMHRTASRGNSFRFQATVVIKKRALVGRDIATFVVFDGVHGGVAFVLPFRVRSP